MAKISIPTEFTLKDKDKKYCDRVFKDYHETFAFLSKLVFHTDKEHGRLCDWQEKSKDLASMFPKELEAMFDKVSAPFILLQELTYYFAQKIEAYFIEQYDLEFEPLEIENDSDQHHSLHSYDLIIWNMKAQVDYFPEKDDE